jgi:hypothetical protein
MVKSVSAVENNCKWEKVERQTGIEEPPLWKNWSDSSSRGVRCDYLIVAESQERVQKGEGDDGSTGSRCASCILQTIIISPLTRSFSARERVMGGQTKSPDKSVFFGHSGVSIMHRWTQSGEETRPWKIL